MPKRESSSLASETGAAPAKRAAALKDAKRAKTEDAAASDADLSDVPEITIAGDVFDRVQVIPHTMTSLVMLIGKYEDEKRVLAPHVELKFGRDPEGEEEGDDADDPEEIFTALLSLENASFILADYASDLANIVGYIKSMASDELPLDKERMIFILKNFNWARQEVDTFITITREILERHGVTEDMEW